MDAGARESVLDATSSQRRRPPAISLEPCGACRLHPSRDASPAEFFYLRDLDPLWAAVASPDPERGVALVLLHDPL